MNKLQLIIFFSAWLISTAYAQEGRVTRVIDGDTLEIITSARKTIRVRLSEIDAPERKQAFGQKAQQALASICAGKTAQLNNTDKDRYGRTLARVNCAGVDANLKMVEIGMAWVYVRYAKDPAMFGAEKKARESQRGLWVDADATPPWEFRRKSK